jgi:hypothetical protein
MCKRKGSTTSTIWPPSTASGYKRSMVIVVNGFITDLPLANRKELIFEVVYRSTKMAHFIPYTKTITGEETTKRFLDNIYYIHGLPNDIVSDMGTQFTSNFWRGIFQLLGVKINLSTTYHPQTDGQTERVNQILEQYLRCTVNYQ